MTSSPGCNEQLARCGWEPQLWESARSSAGAIVCSHQVCQDAEVELTLN